MKLIWRRKLRGWFKYLLLLYQKIARPFLGYRCRFYPSCSDYAIEAVDSHGLFVGVRMAAWRLLRCNQWSKGGFDPVSRNCSIRLRKCST